MNLLERIQELCKQKNLSVTKLEQELNLGKSTIMKWSNASPSVDKLNKVANYFEVSIDYLLGKTEEKKYNNDLKLEGVYLNFAKTAQDNGIDPEDIKLAIDTIKKLRGEI